MISPAFTAARDNKFINRRVSRLPPWFRQDIRDGTVSRIFEVLSRLQVNTVCLEAQCPNLNRCFKNKQVTFMILGEVCTRGCSFCGVKKSGQDSLSVDFDEPRRIAEAVREFRLDYVVITSVTRDDLGDGGAEIFARTIKTIHAQDASVRIEVLIPDFCGNMDSLEKITALAPAVLAHNLETIERLYPVLRPQADYRRSLDLLYKAKQMRPGLITKSSLMLGLGESEAEVIKALEDLRSSGVRIVTLGQYLAASGRHYPVKEFISIKQFEKYRQACLALGFKSVVSAPLARSSSQAKESYEECYKNLGTDTHG